MNNTLLNGIFASCIIDKIGKYSKIPNELSKIVNKSVTRNLDSKIIIEDSFSCEVKSKQVSIEFPIPDLGSNNKFLQLYSRIKNQGLGVNFFSLSVELFFVLVRLSASTQQAKLIEKWGEMGHLGCFLMTDKGGPTLNSWVSECTDNDEGSFSLKIDKTWAIGGHGFDFSIIGVKNKKKMV